MLDVFYSNIESGYKPSSVSENEFASLEPEHPNIEINTNTNNNSFNVIT